MKIEIRDADGKLIFVGSGNLSVTVTTGRPAPTGNKLDSSAGPTTDGPNAGSPLLRDKRPKTNLPVKGWNTKAR